MKSVLKTFSQNTRSLLTKVSLAVLCVCVFSSVGNAQSFMEATDAQTVLKPLLQDMKSLGQDRLHETFVKVSIDDVAIVSPVSHPLQGGDMNLRLEYYTSLKKYIDWVNYPNVVSNAIERNHQKMLLDGSLDADFLEELKLEVTDLLTN